MEFRTKISKTKDGKHLIYGKDILDLIDKNSFVDMFFLLIKGELPKKNEAELLNSILVAATEHGVAAPSAFVPRTVASTGNTMNTALAAGVLTIGEKHGGAVEQIAKILSSGKSAKEIVNEFEGKRIPGFGHKIYKDGDPRTAVLYKKTKELGFSQKFFDLAFDIEKEIEKRKGKKVPLNIDGAMAAVILELGFPWQAGKAMFIIPRLLGMTAHVLEEMEQGNSYHRLEKEDIKEE